MSISERWYWLDWLRVLAMGTIFLYHSGRPFVTIDWHIMNSQPDLLFTIVNIFVSGWIMPLFFMVSGLATYFSLAKRRPSQFAKDRFKRLMIPFLIAGLIVILPVHVYYDRLFHGVISSSFFNFYFWRYFLKDFPFSSNLSYFFSNGNQGIYLWYLFWLFIFSLVTVHFFHWLRKGGNVGKISKLAAICNRRWGIFLLAIPLIIVNIVAAPPFFVFPTGYGGWKLPTYLAFFIIAYLLACDIRFEESIDKNKIITLILGIFTTVLIFSLIASAGTEIASSSLPLIYLIISTLWALNGWCWAITILGFSHKLFNFNHKYLKSLNELVLPFYVLHQTIIVVVAFYVVTLNMIVIEKYLIIVLVSFLIIATLLYPISKIDLLRFLFGMRMKNLPSQKTNVT